jgi:hypothetical protein
MAAYSGVLADFPCKENMEEARGPFFRYAAISARMTAGRELSRYGRTMR